MDTIWEALGVFWEALGVMWGPLGAIWGPLGAMWEPKWAQQGQKWLKCVTVVEFAGPRGGNRAQRVKLGWGCLV